MSRKPADESTRPRHATLAVVLQVRDGVLQVLLWQRARQPYRGAWALPGGLLEPSETLGPRSAGTSRRRSTSVRSRISSSSERTGIRTRPDRVGGRDGIPGARAARSRPGRAGGHPLAPDRRPSRDGLRPRPDRARRARAPARQALVLERRVRPGASHVHAGRAARGLRRRARSRGLRDESPPCPRAPRRDRADG